jgi:hypothetical protein
MILFLLPKNKSAKVKLNSVLPVPLGPTNKNTPNGCCGFLSPSFAASAVSLKVYKLSSTAVGE